jgi:ribonuclease Z
MIRVVVLGSSASMPSKDEFPSCMGIKHGGVYLFDACEGLQKQLMRFKLSYFQVKAIFISHLHADHFLGVFGLIQSLNMSGRKEILTIYTPKGGKHFFSSILSLRQLQSNFPVELIEIDQTRKPFYSNDLFTIKAFKVKHNTEAFGFVLETPPYRRFNMDKIENPKKKPVGNTRKNLCDNRQKENNVQKCFISCQGKENSFHRRHKAIRWNIKSSQKFRFAYS